MKKPVYVLRTIALLLILCTLFSFGTYAIETELDIEPDVEEYVNFEMVTCVPSFIDKVMLIRKWGI